METKLSQKEFEQRRFELSSKIDEHKKSISILRKELRELNNEAQHIDDKHSVIPKQYNSVAEWADGHPFPNVCYLNVFKNKQIADYAHMTNNTYLEYYHVVKEN